MHVMCTLRIYVHLHLTRASSRPYQVAGEKPRLEPFRRLAPASLIQHWNSLVLPPAPLDPEDKKHPLSSAKANTDQCERLVDKVAPSLDVVLGQRNVPDANARRNQLWAWRRSRTSAFPETKKDGGQFKCKYFKLQATAKTQYNSNKRAIGKTGDRKRERSPPKHISNLAEKLKTNKNFSGLTPMETSGVPVFGEDTEENGCLFRAATGNNSLTR